MNFIETSLFYFLVVLLSAALARMSENGKSKAGLVAAVVLLTAVGGLRSYAVGQDTLGYKEGIEYFYAYGTTMWNHTFSVPYGVFTSAVLHICNNYSFLLVVESLITNAFFAFRLWDFRRTASLSFAMFVYTATVFPLSMCLTCQMIAVSLVFYATRFLEQNKPLLFCAWWAVGALLHASALIGVLFLIYYLFSNKSKSRSQFAAKMLASVALLFLAAYAGSKLVDRYARYSVNESSIGLMVFAQATVTMVVSFADMFADAGFQKYLVQHSFRDKKDLHANANVAFWTNFGISVVLWCLIAIFNDPVATFVGNPSLGFPLAVACLSLPLTSFSSIQMALFHRNLDFKSLMPVRLTSTLLNFGSTLVLAFMGFGYWSLIVGTLAANIVNAVGLTLLSEWKPRFFYSFNMLKAMFSFSGWTLLESFTIWLSSWAGTFIVGHFLGAAELGYYKTPVTFVSGCFGIITNATTPILFSSLSRLQFDREEYVAYLRRFQFMVALFLLPLSAGIFVFREPLVALLLGDQWGEATLMFGLYGLVQGPMVLLSYYSSEMYRSLGKPRVSTLVQVMYLVLMTPLMTVAAMQGFDTVVWADAGLRILLIAINQVVTYFVVGLSFGRTMLSLKEPIFCTSMMCAFAWVTYGLASSNWLGVGLDIVGCVVVYFAICFALPKSRRVLLKLVKGGGFKTF